MYIASSIKIYNNLDYIDGVVAYLRVVSKKLNLNDKDTNRICYALEESLNNSISFCFEPDSKEIIQININAITSGIEVTIADNGIPKNPFVHIPDNIEEIEQEISFDNVSNENSDMIGAFSDFVIHKILDNYTYENLGSSGRMLKMCIYSQGTKIGEEKEKTLTTIDKDEYFDSIRFSQSNDALAISRLFHSTYGYTYPNDIVYYPDRLQELLKSTSLISAVAVSNKKNIIGHIALMSPYENSKITEWGMAISNSLFRGQGIMSKLIENIMRRAENSNFYGVFSHSVTNHEFTQKICKSYGFSDVAILIGYTDISLSFRHINNKLSQRESTIINFKPLKKIETIKLYLPENHKKIIKKIYKNLGIKIEQNRGESKIKKPIKKSIFSDHITPSLNNAEIVLKVAGSDVVEQISTITKKLCIAKVDVIYMYINMEDENAIKNIKEFEKMGYFFIGIFPYYHYNHTLVMEYINNIRFDYDIITVLTPMAQELKSYIQKLDPNQVGD